mgnify:CR=1 FL=1
MPIITSIIHMEITGVVDKVLMHTVLFYTLYDLTINSEKVGIEDSVKLIKDYMKIKGIIK